MNSYEKDMLNYLSHPISKRDDAFKYLYCFGIGVMAMGNIKAITELQNYFEKIIDIIELSNENKKQIITDINSYFDFRMNELFRAIKSKDDQYCFIADLYKLYQYSLWSQEYCKKILDNYLDIFRFSNEERKFFENYSNAANKKDIDKAKKVYAELKKQGYDVDYGILVYFFPEFYLEESYKDIRVEAGKTLILDKPVTIEGDIVVERGGSLLIRGALVKMDGSIRVDGGRLQIRDSRIVITGCDDLYWIRLNKKAVVHIEESYIDCGFCCGFLYQDSGRLIVSGGNIHKTDVSRAIDFRGRSAIIEGTDFKCNKMGSIDLYGSARMIISKCKFQDTYAEYGGAIRSESIGNVKFEHCRFEHCQAKYLGAAVYFKYQKYGQYVHDCECIECIPAEDEIFNVYDDDFEMNI